MDNLDFGIHLPVKLFEVNGQAYGLTTTHINTFIVMIGLIIFALFIRSKVKKFEMVPTSKLQVAMETIIGGLEEFVGTTMGEKNKGFTSFYGPMFLFILVSNLMGLIGLRPPTADVATTFALSLTTFFMVQGLGIKSKGAAGHFKGLLQPIPLLLPLNIIGELANPVSLGFRLFGNILGGTIIMGLYYAALPIFLKIGLPAIFHLYFDIFSGVLQALIFVMLSMTFVTGAIEE